MSHRHEIRAPEAPLRRRVVRVCVEHDDRECQQVGSVCGAELAGVVEAVALCELFDDSVDLLRFSRQAELGKEMTKRLVDWQALQANRGIFQRGRKPAPSGLIREVICRYPLFCIEFVFPCMEAVSSRASNSRRAPCRRDALQSGVFLFPTAFTW